MEQKDTGILLNATNIKLHRQYFKEMCKLIGINVIYRAPRKDKHWNIHGELNSFYYEPVVVSCIFDEYPTQYTMKKLGWNAEQQTSTSLIHVPYDLKDLQSGALFIIPSAIDRAKGRVFRVIRMSTIAIYPASVTCEIAPVYENDFEPAQLHNFADNDFTLLATEEEK